MCLHSLWLLFNYCFWPGSSSTQHTAQAISTQGCRHAQLRNSGDDRRRNLYWIPGRRFARKKKRQSTRESMQTPGMKMTRRMCRHGIDMLGSSSVSRPNGNWSFPRSSSLFKLCGSFWAARCWLSLYIVHNRILMSSVKILLIWLNPLDPLFRKTSFCIGICMVMTFSSICSSPYQYLYIHTHVGTKNNNSMKRFVKMLPLWEWRTRRVDRCRIMVPRLHCVAVL